MRLRSPPGLPTHKGQGWATSPPHFTRAAPVRSYWESPRWFHPPYLGAVVDTWKLVQKIQCQPTISYWKDIFSICLPPSSYYILRIKSLTPHRIVIDCAPQKRAATFHTKTPSNVAPVAVCPQVRMNGIPQTKIWRLWHRENDRKSEDEATKNKGTSLCWSIFRQTPVVDLIHDGSTVSIG